MLSERHNFLLVLRHASHQRLVQKLVRIWFAPVKEVVDPARPSVASEMTYSAMTSWRPWMAMGDIPGHAPSNRFGRRAFKIADLPSDYRSFLKQEQPDVFENAEALLTQYQG